MFIFDFCSSSTSIMGRMFGFSFASFSLFSDHFCKNSNKVSSVTDKWSLEIKVFMAFMFIFRKPGDLMISILCLLNFWMASKHGLVRGSAYMREVESHEYFDF